MKGLYLCTRFLKVLDPVAQLVEHLTFNQRVAQHLLGFFVLYLF